MDSKTSFIILILYLGLQINPSLARQTQKPAFIKPDSVVVVKKELAKAGIVNKVKKQVDAIPIKITYGVSIHQNKRDYQEDRFAHTMVGGGDWFGVYDGHGGFEVSNFLAQNLNKIFAQAQGSIEEKQKTAFAQAEKASWRFWPKVGSTALIIYIDKNKTLHCAWVGDTRAVLECNNEVYFVTNDHKPDRPDEKKRIEKAGGIIYQQGIWRINGLAISRSIGDAHSKVKGIGQIIAAPEYKEIHLNNDNHFLILATDGLWDTIKNEEAVQMVSNALKSKMSLNNIAQQLQNAAIEKGSKDNITVCVVKFEKDIKQPDSAIRRFWNWLRGEKFKLKNVNLALNKLIKRII